MKIAPFIRAGVVAALVGSVSGPVAAQQASGLPADLFAKPTGPHAIGSYDWLWVDSSRAERLTRDPNDRRHLPIQVWYPAEPVAGGTPDRYIRTPAEFGPNSTFKPWEHVTTHSVTGAPVAKALKKYPVLVYSHGAGWTRFSATFLTEQLASHGYIVFSIDHPGLDRTSVFADGVPFRADTLGMPTPDPKDMRGTMARSMEYLATNSFPLWVEDSRYVLDRIEALNREPGPFQGRLDLDRIGMLGWSFGGATAIEMLHLDRRVKAAVNHDGRLFGSVVNAQVHGPFMLFHHGIDDVATAPEAQRASVAEMMNLVAAEDSTVEARAQGDWYDVTIARSNHGHFSDLPLFLKTFQDTTLVPARRGHEIIAAYTLAFFDRYLKGTPSPLLAGPSPEYPEATFRRRR